MPDESQVERLSTLIAAAAAVVGEIELARVLRRLVLEAKTTTGARYAALGVIGPHGVLTDFIHEGLSQEHAEQIGSLPKGRGVLGTVVRERHTVVLDNLGDHEDSFGFPEHHPKMTSFLGVPLRVGDDVFGNLYLTDKSGGFDQSDIELVEALAIVAGSAINTARLRDQLEEVAIIQDRDRIARDLHDSIIQDMFAVGLSLQALSERLSDDSTSRVLDDSVDRLDNAVESLRSYIYNLKSTERIRPTLEEQLRFTVDRFTSAYPNQVALNCDPTARVDTAAAEQIVLLVSEALSNALRHSGEGPVQIDVKGDKDRVLLVIRDEGIGFDPANVTRGMGLLNMNDRVHRLGGEFEVVSGPALGTLVTISLPTG